MPSPEQVTRLLLAWSQGDQSALEKLVPHYHPYHSAGGHTFGTRAAEGGASLKDIQEIMDHADINTTMCYVHSAPTSLGSI